MIQTKGNKFNRVCLDMHIEKKKIIIILLR